jgi:hypothetical protein
MSVNAADTRLAREVWAERDGVSFIHPLGHEDERGAWRLAHAHYSGMPPRGGVPPSDPSRGF